MNETCHWWLPNPADIEDERNRAMDLLQETAGIEQRQSSLHELNLWNATLYSNRELVGFRWGEVNAERELWPTNLRTENIIEEIGDAMVSKASSSPLKPTPVPHGKSWKVERAVRELDEYMFGVWRQTKSENAAVEAYLDAFIAHLGCVRVAFDEKAKTMHTESVFFDNVIIDNRECANRAEPRTYRIRQVLPRASVEARYGKPLEPQKAYVDYRNVGDGWVVFVEAWRKPDANGKGGRHTGSCAGVLLFDEPWKHDWVPLAFYHWKDRVSGFFGKSGVEQLVPFQVKQNNLNDTIDLVQDIVCKPRILNHASTQIDVSQWDNVAGRILAWSGGVEPKPFVWPTNLGDLYSERERNKASAFSHVAMSEMFGNADLPPQVRLDSSAGVREARNMEDARHLRSWTRFEAFRMEIARLHLLVLRYSKGASSYAATYEGHDKVRVTKHFEEAIATLTDDNFSWSLEATPLSQMTPAARRETIRDWSSRGLIDDAEARRMEGNPNLERIEDLEMSSFEDVYRHIALMQKGKYEAPTELTNLTFGIKRVTQNLHRLRDMEEVDKIILENHVKWVVTAISIQQAAVQPPSPMTPFSPTQGMAGTSSSKASPTMNEWMPSPGGPPQQ